MLTFLLSAAGVLLLTGVAWALGFREAPRLSQCRALAEACQIPGFRPIAAEIAADGRSARVTGAAGDAAVILPVGDRFIARRLPEGAAAAHDAIDLGEPFLHRVRLGP